MISRTMKNHRIPLRASAVTSAILLNFSAVAAEAPQKNAQDFAAQLSAIRQSGPSYVRLRLETKLGAAKTVFQIQLKARRTKTTTELVYQVLWPKERKGESILLKKTADGAASGFVFVPPNNLRTLDPAQMSQAVFGTDLSYADLIENFFAWDHQSIAGSETVDGVNCQLLESRLGKGERSPYGKVRSWIDATRIVPMRVEKCLANGDVVRRIDTTKVIKDDAGRFIPARLTIRRTGSDSVTELEGTSSKSDVVYGEKEFTPDGLKEVTNPRSGAE
jgi:hypothetical protein